MWPSHLRRGLGGHAISRKGICPASGSGLGSSTQTCSKFHPLPPRLPPLSGMLTAPLSLQTACSWLERGLPSTLRWANTGVPEAINRFLLLCTSNSHIWFFSFFLLGCLSAPCPLFCLSSFHRRLLVPCLPRPTSPFLAAPTE